MNECALCLQRGDVVAEHDEWRVILVDDPAFPGFCRVIWRAHVQEMSDLDAARRDRLMQVVWQVERTVRDVMQPDKINLASLGNVVPHLHWHVIPRFRDDSHFPNPIWGQAERADSPALAARRGLVGRLRARLAQDLLQQLEGSRLP